MASKHSNHPAMLSHRSVFVKIKNRWVGVASIDLRWHPLARAGMHMLEWPDVKDIIGNFPDATGAKIDGAYDWRTWDEKRAADDIKYYRKVA